MSSRLADGSLWRVPSSREWCWSGFLCAFSKLSNTTANAEPQHMSVFLQLRFQKQFHGGQSQQLLVDSNSEKSARQLQDGIHGDTKKVSAKIDFLTVVFSFYSLCYNFSLCCRFSVHQLLAIFPHPLPKITHTTVSDILLCIASRFNQTNKELINIKSCSTHLCMSEN